MKIHKDKTEKRILTMKPPREEDKKIKTRLKCLQRENYLIGTERKGHWGTVDTMDRLGA